MPKTADPDIVRFNKAVFALPPEERLQYIQNGRVVVPDNPREALERLFASTSITGMDLQRRERHEAGATPYLRGFTDSVTMEDFWRLQGWTTIDRKTGKERLTYAKWIEGESTKIEAIKFLIDRVLKKDPRDVTLEDFYSNRLSGLLSHYYEDSPYAAVTKAYPGLDIKAWEMLMTPNGFYDHRESRVAAVRWLVEKLGKGHKEITVEDFYSNRLGGLLAHYYAGSPYAAIVDAYPGLGIYPWEMAKAPNKFYNVLENRVSAARWLVEKLGKDPRDITRNDFKLNRLEGLLQHHGDSPYEVLLEAGAVSREDELYMRATGSLRHGL